MDAFIVVSGTIASLPLANIDTDIIIPIARLTQLRAAELGRYAFEALRYLPDGSENPEFPLNSPPFREASILVTGANFGCGSSREAAVWALKSYGLRCVIAASFGDIFYDNCIKNGILPVRVTPEQARELLALSAAGASGTVDLRTQQVTVPGMLVEFEIDRWRKESLLQGLDGIEYTLRNSRAIQHWQQLDQAARPWAWQPMK